MQVAGTHSGRQDPGPIRVALVLSGGVALGSFEAGVVYELLAAVEHGAPFSFDLLAGTSAGALVGATAARSLLSGDPYGPGLRRWTQITLDVLTEVYERPSQARQRGKPVDVAMLSSESVRRMIRDLLVKGTADGVPFTTRYPAGRTVLLVTMTNLDGLPGTGVAGDEYRYAEGVVFSLFQPPADRQLPREVWERIGEIIYASAAFPGAFDPVMIDWERRLRLPGVAMEDWENGPLLADLNRRYPGLQARMRYSDGGLMDNQPLERAVAALPYLTGGPGETGPEGLVFDPRRVFIFVEPDPPVTALDEITSSKPMGLTAAMGRALRIFTLATSPHSDRQRLLAANARIVRLLQFLTALGQQIQDGYRPQDGADAAGLLERCLASLGLTAGGVPAGPGGPAALGAGFGAGQGALALPGLVFTPRDDEEPGLIPPDWFRMAVPAFYAWLGDEERSEADLTFMDKVGAHRLYQEQQPIRETLRRLRAAYRGLWGLDPQDPDRYQRLLVDAHATLALSLGLNRPWILLSYVAPDDPQLHLRGEQAIHFGGFFSREFQEHDFEVGRYYARHWLLQVLPDYSPTTPVEPPVASSEGVTWKEMVDNWLPLRKMTGRLLTAVGWIKLGAWERGMAMALAIALAFTAACSVLWAIAVPLRWLTGRPDLVEAQGILAAGGALFPLVLGLFLLLVVPHALYVEFAGRWWRRLIRGSAAAGADRRTRP